jgi:hypothetical protein
MKLSFHGAPRSVTGSRHLIEAEGGAVLFQAEHTLGRKLVEGWDMICEGR